MCTTREECAQNQLPPSGVKPKAHLSEGLYYRNVKPDDLAKRFAGDDNVNPQYGKKIKLKKWRWGTDRSKGLSVNQALCVRSALCSILVTPRSDGCTGVVQIDIAALTRRLSRKEEFPLVAEYDPTEDNKCHFNILPANHDLAALELVLYDMILSTYPTAKMPASETEHQQALDDCEWFRQIFNIIDVPTESLERAP